MQRMPTNLPHLAQRLFNVPLAIHPAKAEMVVAALADRLGVAHLFRDGASVALAAPRLEAMGLAYGEDAPRAERAYDVTPDGVAIIPVTGTLVQKSGSLRPYCGMTGYDGIRVCLLDALNDDAIKAIVLDIDSPGGEVSGCFDLVDMIYQARGGKPIHAILAETAFSAAYAIASAADRITVPRTGGTGSVGVICLHTDFSRALDKGGIAVTMITYGARKADGQEYAPLSKEALARYQADIDTIGTLFVETVARNRGLKVATVRDTQATTFLGAAGVGIGFADDVMAPDAAFRSLLAAI